MRDPTCGIPRQTIWCQERAESSQCSTTGNELGNNCTLNDAASTEPSNGTSVFDCSSDDSTNDDGGDISSDDGSNPSRDDGHSSSDDGHSSSDDGHSSCDDDDDGCGSSDDVTSDSRSSSLGDSDNPLQSPLSSPSFNEDHPNSSDRTELENNAANGEDCVYHSRLNA